MRLQRLAAPNCECNLIASVVFIFIFQAHKTSQRCYAKVNFTFATCSLFFFRESKEQFVTKLEGETNRR